jgi:hypothetical protein
MTGTSEILGAVALLIVAVALILALIIFVLVEARWALRLWVSLYQRWNTSIQQLRDDDDDDDKEGGTPEKGRDSSRSSKHW